MAAAFAFAEPGAAPGAALWRALARGARARLVLAGAASLVGGIATTGLIVLINGALHASEPARADRIAAFVATALVACAALVVSRALFADLGQRGLVDLRSAIAARVQAAAFADIEAVGGARVQALVTEDANQVANFLTALPVLVTNCAVIAATLAYLGYLSFPLPGPDAIARSDNFFERGGDSILVMKLAAAVQKNLGSRLPLRAVFDHPTLAELAARIDADGSTGRPGAADLTDMESWLDAIETAAGAMRT